MPASMFRRRLVTERRGEHAPTEWRDWLTTLFPKHFYHPLGQRHVDLWRWVLEIKLGEPTRPFVGIWPRGAGKSTSAEVAAVALGVRGRRKYAVYVRETQDQADKSVANIASLLESAAIDRYYPDHATPQVGKFGNQKGWRRTQLRTAGGFTVDALGLDTAARGVKVDEQRPDLFIFDDIDGKFDSPGVTKKKKETLTHTILPAGAKNVAVLSIQNLILDGGIFTQLADGSADFLTDRQLSGPFEAIEGFEYEWQLNPTTGMRRAVITKGRATWEGQNLEACQRSIDLWGVSAFVKEAQHKVKGRAAGVCIKYSEGRHGIDLPDHRARQLVAQSHVFGGIDFGSWRFGFTLWVATHAGIVIRMDELFSQQESLGTRARRIHEMCVANGVTDPSPRSCPIWGDAANPTDIREINIAWQRGWEERDEQGHETGRRITSRLRVVAVMAEHKARKTAVDRINDALDRNALRFRRGVGLTATWLKGQSASEEGVETHGSRLLWEIDNWAVPVPKAGEAQDQNPDDDTADGADMIASARYALMSHWRPKKGEAIPPDVESDRAKPFDAKEKKFKEPAHLADLLETPGRRTPSVRSPRPRFAR